MEQKNLKKAFYAAITLSILALLVLPVATSADERTAEEATSLVELEVYEDTSGELVARLLLQDGHRGSVYFEETPRGLGLVPRVQEQDRVTLRVYEVEPVDEQEQRMDLIQVLRGISGAEDQKSRRIDMPDVGTLRVNLVAVHHPEK